MPTYLTDGLVPYSGWKSSIFFSATYLEMSLLGIVQVAEGERAGGAGLHAAGLLLALVQQVCAHGALLGDARSSSFQKITRYGQAFTICFWPLAFSGSMMTMPSSRR